MTTIAVPLSTVRIILDWSVLSSLMALASCMVMLGLGVGVLSRSLLVSALSSAEGGSQ